MMNFTLRSLIIFSLLYTLVSSTFTQAQEGPCDLVIPRRIFCDDFEDGSATDGMPVTWDPSWSGATIEVAGESMIVSNRPLSSAWVRESYTDVSVRARMRLLVGEALGLQTRLRLGAPVDNYYGLLLSDGNLLLGGNRPIGVVELGQAKTSLDPLNEDVMMRMDVVGTEIKLWAWQADEAMPTQPLISAEDDQAPFGFISVVSGTSDGTNSSAAFRYVDVIAIPEPSSAVLCLGGIKGLLGLRRRRRTAAPCLE